MAREIHKLNQHSIDSLRGTSCEWCRKYGKDLTHALMLDPPREMATIAGIATKRYYEFVCTACAEEYKVMEGLAK